MQILEFLRAEYRNAWALPRRLQYAVIIYGRNKILLSHLFCALAQKWDKNETLKLANIG